MNATALYPFRTIDLCRKLDGKQLNAVVATAFNVSIDSRNSEKDALFFAIIGEKYDGHDFIAQVCQQAAIIVVSREPSADIIALATKHNTTIIQVDNTTTALQQWAKHYRQSLIDTTVICITGSNGKTSTKDMLATFLSSKEATFATVGNLNNHYGLPLSILSTRPHHHYAIWEIGMNHPGEIAPLVAIALPQLAVITSIGTAHIEHFADKAAIAKEKAMIASTLTSQQLLFIMADCAYQDMIIAHTAAKIYRVGTEENDALIQRTSINDKQLQITLELADEQHVVTLPFLGDAMQKNMLLAFAVAQYNGCSAQQLIAKIPQLTLHSGRMELLAGNNYLILNDSYNANLDSMLHVISTAQNFAADQQYQLLFIFGELAELGDFLATAYQKIVQHISLTMSLQIACIGVNCQLLHQQLSQRQLASLFFQDKAQFANWLPSNLPTEKTLIVLKGSRKAALETLIPLF